MTLAGWIFMLASVLVVVALTLFCYARVLTNSHPSSTDASPESDSK